MGRGTGTMQRGQVEAAPAPVVKRGRKPVELPLLSDFCVRDEELADKLRELEAILADVNPDQTDTPITPADPDDDLRIYRQQVGRYKLLTEDQELLLAQLMRDRDLARQRLASAPEHEHPTLQARIVAGNRAQARLIEANLRLVLALARKYGNGSNRLPDIIQEGNKALIQAVSKYDHTRPNARDETKRNRLTTYASWWIDQGLKKAFGEQHLVRKPAHVVAFLNRYRAVHSELLVQLGREPNLAEICEVLGEAPEKALAYLRSASGTVSLSHAVGEDGDGSLVEMVEDKNAVDPDEDIAQGERTRTIFQVLSRLELRERLAVALYHGLAGKYFQGQLTRAGEIAPAEWPYFVRMMRRLSGRMEPGVAEALALVERGAPFSATERQRLVRVISLFGEDPLPFEEVGGVLGVTREGAREAWGRGVNRLRHPAFAGQLRTVFH